MNTPIMSSNAPSQWQLKTKEDTF